MATRTGAGYRQYAEKDLHILSFIRHSRDLGFSIKQIQALLSLWQDPHRSSGQVKALATAHMAALTQKIQSLMSIQSELQTLMECCHGNDRPACPILDQLALSQTKQPGD